MTADDTMDVLTAALGQMPTPGLKRPRTYPIGFPYADHLTNGRKETPGQMKTGIATDELEDNHPAWFMTEAAAFLGAPQRTAPERLAARVAVRMRRRTRLESIISGSILHSVRAALYVGAAYAVKVLFGISIAVSHVAR